MRFLLGLTRTLVALSMGLWIGGLFFFGAITAAVMFPMTIKAGVPQMAPLMVGPMLSHFGVVCSICSVVLLVGWLVDGLLTKSALWWRLQGVLTILAVGLGAYLNFGLLPAVERDQPAAIPLYVRSKGPHPSFTPAELELRARFDAKHERSSTLFFVDIYLLIGALACLMARSLPVEVGNLRKN